MAAQITSRQKGCGDRGALLQEVLRAHEALLRRDAARHARCPADADGAFSDACFRFLSHFGGGEDPEHALRWMRIAVKHSAQAHRRDQRRQAPSAAIAVDVSRALFHRVADHDHEQRERLAQLAELKPDERTALMLLAAGYSYAEIAELRGWTRTKVNRCLAEGRAALRRMEGGEN